ncbi:MAG: hypothetical protein ABJK59_03140 [Erythrobacter sp.]|uniref:hypothetical protein n=1 Tax=Erythrobacter sp. TaxID=1042 RepID=UPI0032981097
MSFDDDDMDSMDIAPPRWQRHVLEDEHASINGDMNAGAFVTMPLSGRHAQFLRKKEIYKVVDAKRIGGPSVSTCSRTFLRKEFSKNS